MADRAAPYPERGSFNELTRARIRELTREPEAVFWVFVFPILLAAVLGLAFRSGAPAPIAVAVVDGPGASTTQAALATSADLAPRVMSETDARAALRRGHVVVVISNDTPPTYAYDPTQPDSRSSPVPATWTSWCRACSG
jgi:hypothetical protein